MYLYKMFKKSPFFKPARPRSSNKSASGSALIEVLIASIILILALMGYSSSYVSARKQIINQRTYQLAVQLTSQKLEEIRAKEYPEVLPEETEESLYTDDIFFTRKTVIELTDTPSQILPQPCKKVTVTTEWSGSVGELHEVSLVTYIGP